MKTLLERYIECSDRYIDACHGAVYMDLGRGIVLNDEDPAKALDKAGKALSQAAKAKGVDTRELNEHIIMFISANVSSKISNKEAAKELVELRVQRLKILLGIK